MTHTNVATLFRNMERTAISHSFRILYTIFATDAKYLKDIADAGKMSSRESDHKQRCSIFFVIAREIICCSDFVQLLTQSCFFFSVFPCFVNAISAIGCPDHSHSLYSQQLYIRKVCINQLRKMIKKLKLV